VVVILLGGARQGRFGWLHDEEIPTFVALFNYDSMLGPSRTFTALASHHRGSYELAQSKVSDLEV
jgi:hypothetical protein